MAIDYESELGRVRLLISDTDETNLILSDDQINAFISIEGDVKLAAASALDTIATSEALVLKVMQKDELRTDGAAVAKALREHAKSLREEAHAEGFFDIVEFTPYPPRGPELT